MSVVLPAPDGVYLAFDTATDEGSVAVARGPEVLGRVRLQLRAEHAARLVPAIEEALGLAGVDRHALSGVVVGAGPGSFTGVRVAAATAKGLTRALSIPLWAVSSLAAVALASDRGSTRYALFDARGDRVYGACYQVDERSVRTLIAPHAGTLGDAVGADVPKGTVFIGDAARRHRRVLEAGGHVVVLDAPDRSTAEGLLAYVALRPDFEAVDDPGGWEPAYLRGSVAVPA